MSFKLFWIQIYMQTNQLLCSSCNKKAMKNKNKKITTCLLGSKHHSKRPANAALSLHQLSNDS